MSRIRANKITNKIGTGAVELEKGAHLPIGMGITGAGGVNITGVVTAASFSGSGAALTGIDATSIKDPAGNVKIQAQASGAVYTGIHTFGTNTNFTDVDVDGHTNLDNVNVAGVATFASAVNTGALTASSGTFSGNVSIGGTLTYEDVKNVDSVGVGTFRGGIKVGSGVTIEPNGQATFTGIVTFGSSSTTIDGDANTVKVGTALTLGHTQGLQFHTQNLHSAGFEVNQINATGVITATSFSGSGANLTGLASREFYGFKTVNEDLILIHTNNGADNISKSDFESFEDTMTAPSGLSFTINSAGELEMTI